MSVKNEYDSCKLTGKKSLRSEYGYIKMFLAFVLSFSLASGLLLASRGEKAAHASSADNSGIMIGAAGLDTKDVNTAKAPVVYYAGEPWYVLGYDENKDSEVSSGSGDETIFKEPGTATLLAKDIIGMSAFDTDANRGGGTDSCNNIYEGSLLQTYLDNVYNGRGEQSMKFTLPEKNAVKPRNLEGGGGLYDTGIDSRPEDEPEYDNGKVRGPEVKSAGLWPLSSKEATKLNASIKKLTKSWWLRSPGSYETNASYMNNYGRPVYVGVRVYFDEYGVRPAFYLDLDSVMFMSVAAEATDTTGTEYKLTLKDKNLSASVNGSMLMENGTVTVPYKITGDNASKANKVSVILLNSEYVPGNSVTDGKNEKGVPNLTYIILDTQIPEAQDGAVAGSGTFTLPEEYDSLVRGEDYFAYLLAEITNEDKSTDYASEPQYIGIDGTIGGCTWSLSNDLKTLTIAKAVNGDGKLPDYGYKDPSIPWSGYKNKITNVVISEGVTYIGENMFNYPNFIETVSIPGSVEKIGDYAFENCSALTTVTIGEGVEEIGYYTFKNCSSLTQVSIPGSVKWIGGYAFENCSALTSATINLNDKIEFDKGIFENTDKLDSIKLVVSVPESEMKRIQLKNLSLLGTEKPGKYILAKPSAEDSYIDCKDFIPDIIVPDAFYTGSEVKPAVTVKDGEKKLVENTDYTVAYSNNTDVGTGTVTITGKGVYLGKIAKEFSINPSGTIGGCVWSVSSDWKKLTIEKADDGDGSLVDFYHDDEIRPWDYADTITYLVISEGVTYIGEYMFDYPNIIETVSIPGSVKQIGHYAFNNCSALTTVTIGEGVEKIEDNAFRYCSSLTQITIPGSVEKIEDYAFKNCSALTTVTIGEGVEKIGDGAFGKCSSLNQITIPGSVKRIGNYAFENCSALTSATINLNDQIVFAKGIFENTDKLDSIKLVVPVPESGMKSIFVENVSLAGTEKPGEYVLAKSTENSYIKCIDLDPKVEVSDVFYTGSEVKPAVTVEAGGEELVENTDYTVAYSNNTDIGTGTVTITGKGFYLGTLTKEFNIIEISGKIGDCTWELSADHQTLTIGGTGNMEDLRLGQYPWAALRENIKTLVIEEGVAYISANAFSNFSELSEVTIPGSVKTIGGGAFYNCEKIAALTIQDGVEEIGDFAFSDCDKLSEVIIPESIGISIYAFEECDNLSSLTIMDGDIVGSYAFHSCPNLEAANLEVGEKGITIWALAFDDNTALVPCIKTSGDGLKKLKTSFGELKEDGITGKVLLSVEWNPDQYSLDEWERVVLSLEAVTPVITVADATYTGNALKPAVTVKDGAKTLTAGTDYTVSYSNNTNVGTGTVTITGKGIYGGTVTKNFTINKSGEDPMPGGDDDKELAGDVDGDGSIDAKDVTMLRRHLAGGWGVIINEANADVNADGVIDAKDVTSLRRYLAGGWGVVLGKKQ